MNANLRKEIRSLLPTFGITVALTLVASLVFYGSDATGIVTFIFSGCCALMAACSYGNEFQSRTLSLLLTQPAARSRIWRDKTTVLGVALAIACLAALISIRLFITGEGKPANFADLFAMLIGVALIALCSAPSLTLSIKNIFGAACTMAAFPFALWVLIMAVDWLVSWFCSRPEEPFFTDSYQAHPYRYIWALLAIYCAALYWLGYKMFARFQLIESQSQEIALPAKLEAGLAPILKRLLPGYTGPVASLIRKEIQLHRTSFIIAGAACALVACSAVMHEIHDSEIDRALMIIAVVLCFLMIPLITGAVCIAEERSWGMSGWQLTQPPSAFKQWLIKILVAFAITMVLGIVLPVAMINFFDLLQTASIKAPPLQDLGPLASGPILLLYILVVSLIIYASSISTNTMRAIIMFLGLLAGIGLIIGLATDTAQWASHNDLVELWAGRIRYGNRVMSGEQLKGFIQNFLVTATLSATGVLVAPLWYLTLFNFRNPEFNFRRRCVQLMLIGLSICGMIAVMSGTLPFWLSRPGRFPFLFSSH